MPSAGICSADQAERIGGKVDQQQEEHLHGGDDGRSMREELRIDFVAHPQDQRVGRKQPRPEEQRAFLARPQRGELVGDGQVAIAVVQDVGDGEIIAQRGHHQRQAGDGDRGPGGDAGAARSLAQVIVLAGQPQRSRNERVGGQRQGQQERKTSNLWHENLVPVCVQRRIIRRHAIRWMQFYSQSQDGTANCEGGNTTLREREVAQRFRRCDQSERARSSADSVSRTGGQPIVEEITRPKEIESGEEDGHFLSQLSSYSIAHSGRFWSRFLRFIISINISMLR